MGNVALCAPSIVSNTQVKILSINGSLLIYTRAPIKAAEIMLENPGHFLCESTQLRVGQRIAGVTAEEELERGQVYFLLPMEMLYSVLTDEEMKVLTQRTGKGMSKQPLNFSKIFPEFCLFPNGSKGVEDLGEICGSDCLVQGERFSRQRSWQPALETIIETPPHT